MKKLILILIIAALFASALVSCSTGKGEATVAPGTPEESGGADSAKETAGGIDLSHGVLVGVTYTCNGMTPSDETFSYHLSETETGVYRFEAIRYDDDGNPVSTSREVTLEDMQRVRLIFERYRYSELIGQRQKIDPDDEDAEGVATYYFSGTYADGKSFSTDSAGDGAGELRQFFDELLEKS